MTEVALSILFIERLTFKTSAELLHQDCFDLIWLTATKHPQNCHQICLECNESNDWCTEVSDITFFKTEEKNTENLSCKTILCSCRTHREKVKLVGLKEQHIRIAVWLINNPLTTILFLVTQQSAGKSCSMGTRNCRQPSQWHSSSIIPIRFMMRTMALARS